MRKAITMAIIMAITVLLTCCGNKIEYANIVDIDCFGLTRIDSLGKGEDGHVKAVRINIASTTVVPGPRLELMGDLEFKGLVGDVLVFIYTDGVWREIGRRLK